MNPNTQILGYAFTATATGLSRAFRVNFDHFSTSFHRFVGQHIKERAPRRIIDVFVKCFGIIFNHLFRGKIFDKYHPEQNNKLSAEFMQKVFPLICNLFMQPAKCLSSLAGAFFGVFLLSGLKLFFALLKMLGVVDQFSVTCGGKGFDAHVDTDLFVVRRQRLFRHIVAGKGSIISAVAPLDRNCFDQSFNIPVQFDSNGPDILNVKLAVFKAAAVPVAWECNRVKAMLALEPWEPRRFAPFDSGEKSLECFIQAAQQVLSGGKVQSCDAFVKLPDLFKRIGLVIVGNGFTPLIPANGSLLQSAIVKKSCRIEKPVKVFFLIFVGKQPVFERFAQLLSLLIRNIFHNCFFTDMPNATGIVATTPKGRQPAFQFPEFFSKYSAGIAFESVDYFRNASGRVMFNEKVDMIRHYFQCMYLEFKFIRFGFKQVFKSLRNSAGQHFAAIFRAPYYV